MGKYQEDLLMMRAQQMNQVEPEKRQEQQEEQEHVQEQQQIPSMSRSRVDRMAAERELMQSSRQNAGYTGPTHRHPAPPKTRPKVAPPPGRKTKSSKASGNRKKASSRHAARAPNSSLD